MPYIPTRSPSPFRLQALAAAALLSLAGAASAQVYNWSAGTFAPGVTAPATLAPPEVLNINGGGFKYFDGSSGTFTNGGTVNWNADSLYLQGGAIVNNALWDSKADQTLVYNGGNPSFTNNGTFRKSGGSGSTTVQPGVGFVNNGVLDAASGTIEFVGGSTFNAGTVFTGAGRNLVSGGVNTFNGAFTSNNLVLAGGSHSGVSATLGGSALFSGGSLVGSWAVAAGAQLTIGSGGFKYIDGAGSSFTNAGTVLWTHDALYLQSGAQVTNNGVWESTGDLALIYNGGAGPTFTNNGTLRKSGGSGTMTVGNGAGFVNHGVVEAQSGTIQFSGGSTFNAGSSFVGAGRVVASSGVNTFSGGFSSANLVLDSGTHQGAGAAVNGVVRFEGGRLGGSWTVNAGQTLAGADGGFKYINGTLTNAGTVAWNTGNALYLENGGTLVNNGLFVATVGSTLLNNGGTQPLFDNRGTLRAAAGTTLNVGSSLFVNNGGTLDAEAGASIRYSAGSVFNAGSVFSGAGSNVAIGSNAYNGSQISSNLELQAGSHAGGAAVIQGLVVLSGGALTGTWSVGPGSTLRGADGGFKYVSGTASVLTNDGTLDWSTGGALYLESGATLRNRALFVASTGSTLANNGGAQPLLDNTGTLRAAPGVTLTVQGNLLVNNGGTLDAQAGGSIRYHAGSVFNAGTLFTGAGSNVVVDSSSFNGAFVSANLLLQGGTLTGNAAVAGGTVVFGGGVMTGTWQVPAGSTLTGVDGGFKYLSGGTLDNRGTLAWNTGGALYLQSGAVLTNAGTLDLQTDTTIANNGGAASSFVNTGLIVKSAGAGAATIQGGLGFDNQGTMDVQSGTLALPPNFVNRGLMKGTGSYSASGTTLTNAGTLAPGASPGTLALQGNYVQTAAGTFAVELESPTRHDLFSVSGSAVLDGTLAISCWAACSFAVGDVVTILDSAGDLSGSFASVTLSGFATGAFSVVYDTAADRVQLLVTQAVTAVPEPRSVAMWLAGLGALGWLSARRRRRFATA